MEIHHLKIFYETCNEKSFTKAARKLFISQSAVSIQIKKLETTLGVTLIERDSKNFKLTFAGKELYRLAQQVFNRISRMENEMFKIIKENKTKIVIGATHNIGEPVLPKIVSEYSKRNKEVEFEIYIKNSSSLIKYIKDGVIDVALMEEEIFDEREIKMLQTDVYPFVVVAPPNVTDLEIIKEMSMLKKDSPLALKYIEKFEEIIDHVFENKLIVNGSNETTKNLVMNGMGISVLPYYCVYEEIRDNKLSLVHEFDISEDKFQIALLKENEAKPWISKFLDFIKEFNIRYEFNSIIKKNK
ncbi:MAG: LysR family transcriptional regulator [Streptobacillus sp.]|jgi:transcriptional regulator, lysR family